MIEHGLTSNGYKQHGYSGEHKIKRLDGNVGIGLRLGLGLS